MLSVLYVLPRSRILGGNKIHAAEIEELVKLDTELT
jgi:hypothetical protein